MGQGADKTVRKKTNMDLTFEGERTKQTEEKEQRLRKKGEREGRDAKKKIPKNVCIYISHTGQ